MGGMTFIQKAKALDYTKSVKYLLHDHLAGLEPDRGKKTVHASELTKDEDVCPREYALYDVTHAKPGVALSQRPRRTSPSPWAACCRTLSSRRSPT